MQIGGLAIESRSLEQLKQEAARDPKAAAQKAATQFEAMFLQMVLKSMRDATPQSTLFQDSSQQTMTSMLDAQLAQKMASRGTGLAQVLTQQLTRQMGGSKAGPGATEAPQISLDRLRAQLKSPVQNPLNSLPPTRMATEKTLSTTPPALNAAKLSPAQAEFVQRLWSPALAAEKSTGVPALFIIGQAALETGWGKHEIRDAQGNTSFNLFGIKANSSWKGPSVSARTTEYLEQGQVKVVEKFRAYQSYAHAFEDWARLMSTSPRYGQVMKSGGSVSDFAQGLQRAGYATDPAYASKLTRTIEATLQIRKLVT